MKLLLDTHSWLWSLAAPERLNKKVQHVLCDSDSVLHLSAASTWEMAIKVRLGKLKLPVPLDEYIATRLTTQHVQSLFISHAHAAHVSNLPLLHRNPFDRLLIAQAQLENLTLVTADSDIARYDVNIVWAA